MSRGTGGQKLAFKTLSTQYFNSIWVGRLFIATRPPALCFWYPFMNLDLVVRGPISANG